MEDDKGLGSIRDRVVTLILDNGVSLTLTVCFCLALYYILHKHNELLLEQIYKLIKDKEELVEQLLECYDDKSRR